MKLIGFDIGGTKCATILGETDASGQVNIVEKIVFPTKKGPEASLTAIYSSTEELCTKWLAAVADCRYRYQLRGPLDSRNGIILSPPNLPGWDNVPIVEMTENVWESRLLSRTTRTRVLWLSGNMAQEKAMIT